MNNIKGLEIMLKYEIHPSLKNRYFPGEAEKSHGKTKSWLSVTRPSFEEGALPKQARNITNCANSIHANQLVKQDWSRRRTLMEAFSELGSTQSCQMFCICDSAHLIAFEHAWVVKALGYYVYIPHVLTA